MSAWPGTLPQKPINKTWSGAPQNNVLAFQPEVGPPITRRRSSAVAHVYRGTFDFSETQLATFETFFSSTLEDGALSFTWNDPISGTNYSWKFVAQNSPYEVMHRGTNDTGERFHVTVNLVRLPS